MQSTLILRVIHYFKDSHSEPPHEPRCGYLVMKYIDSKDGAGSADAVLQALLNLWSLPLPQPATVGPFDNDYIASGIPLGRETSIFPRFKPTTESNDLLNYHAQRRRGARPKTFDFQRSELIVLPWRSQQSQFPHVFERTALHPRLGPCRHLSSGGGAFLACIFWKKKTCKADR